MENIKNCLTLSLPGKQDSLYKRITSLSELNLAGSIYEDTLHHIVEDLESRKYGDLKDLYTYESNAGYFENEQRFTFIFNGSEFVVSLTDVCIDPDGNFNEPLIHIECTVSHIPDNIGDMYLLDEYAAATFIPEEYEYLVFDDFCEYECLYNVLDVLFSEINKCYEAV